MKPLTTQNLKFPLLLFALTFVWSLSSCTTVPPPPPLPDPVPIQEDVKPSARRSNAVHIVAPGETLWRVSKMYDVPVANILKANRMSSFDNLKMGQKILIPSAAPIKPIISLPKSRKWRYIVIHHSGTDEGSSLSFHRAHLKKGWDKGVGYHFIIDNGSGGKQDGQIEVSPRWIKQEDGAHCKAGGMNIKAIGICLVGNFNNDTITKAQMESLVFLVNMLRENYSIPVRNILRHGHVSGALTDCPGKHFPWERFKKKLYASEPTKQHPADKLE